MCEFGSKIQWTTKEIVPISVDYDQVPPSQTEVPANEPPPRGNIQGYRDDAGILRVPETNFIRLRGLPKTCSEGEVRKFLNGIEVVTVDLSNHGGVLAELSDKEEVCRALWYHNKAFDVSFNIEVFPVSKIQLGGLNTKPAAEEETQVKQVDSDLAGTIVRLRGAPFRSTERDIREFFGGLDCAEIVFEKINGSSTGELYVRFGTREHCLKAYDMHRQKIGSRWIEVFRSFEGELERCKERSKPKEPSNQSSSTPNPRNAGRAHMGDEYTYTRQFFDFPTAYKREGPTAPSAQVSTYKQTEHLSKPGFLSRDASLNNSPYKRPEMPSLGKRPEIPAFIKEFKKPVIPSLVKDYKKPENPSLLQASVYKSHETISAKLPGGGNSVASNLSENRVYLRRLPLTAKSEHVDQFFAPLKCYNLRLGFRNGLRTSDIYVEFGTSMDAQRALTYDGKTISNRVIDVIAGDDVRNIPQDLLWWPEEMAEKASEMDDIMAKGDVKISEDASKPVEKSENFNTKWTDEAPPSNGTQSKPSPAVEKAPRKEDAKSGGPVPSLGTTPPRDFSAGGGPIRNDPTTKRIPPPAMPPPKRHEPQSRGPNVPPGFPPSRMGPPNGAPYPMRGNSHYGGPPNDYGGPSNGYGGPPSGFGGPPSGFGGPSNGYGGPPSGFGGPPSGVGGPSKPSAPSVSFFRGPIAGPVAPRRDRESGRRPSGGSTRSNRRAGRRVQEQHERQKLANEQKAKAGK